MSVLPWLVAAWLFGACLYGIISSRGVVRLVGCLGACQIAAYVLLLSLGHSWDAGPPTFFDHPPGTPPVAR